LTFAIVTFLTILNVHSKRTFFEASLSHNYHITAPTNKILLHTMRNKFY